MPSFLMEHLPEIRRRVASASTLTVFLDFDGSLVPCACRPEVAEVAPAMRQVLLDLARQDKVTLAVLSGRPRADLLERVPIPRAFYGGNHGLEISGPGRLFIEPDAAAMHSRLHQLAEELTAQLRSFPGVRVENGGLAIRVHYQLVDQDQHEDLWRKVHAVVAGAKHYFLLTPGMRTHEIRPRVYWTRGSAVRWIGEQIGDVDTLTLCFGGDVVDESAFAELSDGITVKVGQAAETTARYQVADSSEVQGFLYWLSNELRALKPSMKQAELCYV